MAHHKKILELEESHRAERTARFARVRRLMRWLPRRSNLHRYPLVRRFAEEARSRPYLWAFRVVSVRRALYAGALIAFLPIYGLQLLLAFWAALFFRAHLGLTLAIQFLTNPLTAAPFYYLTYRVGMWIIATSGIGEGHPTLGTRFNALILGGIVVGLAVGVLLDLLLRFVLWEARILRERHQRTRLEADAARAEVARREDTVPGGEEPPARASGSASD